MPCDANGKKCSIPHPQTQASSETSIVSLAFTVVLFLSILSLSLSLRLEKMSKPSDFVVDGFSSLAVRSGEPETSGWGNCTADGIPQKDDTNAVSSKPLSTATAASKDKSIVSSSSSSLITTNRGRCSANVLLSRHRRLAAARLKYQENAQQQPLAEVDRNQSKTKNQPSFADDNTWKNNVEKTKDKLVWSPGRTSESPTLQVHNDEKTHDHNKNTTKGHQDHHSRSATTGRGSSNKSVEDVLGDILIERILGLDPSLEKTLPIHDWELLLALPVPRMVELFNRIDRAEEENERKNNQGTVDVFGCCWQELVQDSLHKE